MRYNARIILDLYGDDVSAAAVEDVVARGSPIRQRSPSRARSIARDRRRVLPIELVLPEDALAAFLTHAHKRRLGPTEAVEQLVELEDDQVQLAPSRFVMAVRAVIAARTAMAVIVAMTTDAGRRRAGVVRGMVVRIRIVAIGAGHLRMLAAQRIARHR